MELYSQEIGFFRRNAMNANKCANENEKNQDSHENLDTKNTKRIEARRRIEELFEEKRLRDEIELNY